MDAQPADQQPGAQQIDLGGLGGQRGALPAGITFFGRAWSEPTLIRLAYDYEQLTQHRAKLKLAF